MNLKLIRETLDEEITYRYVLFCDGHVADFKKEPMSKPCEYAWVHFKDGQPRIMCLTNTFRQSSEDIKIIPVEVLEAHLN